MNRHGEKNKPRLTLIDYNLLKSVMQTSTAFPCHLRWRQRPKHDVPKRRRNSKALVLNSEVVVQMIPLGITNNYLLEKVAKNDPKIFSKHKVNFSP